MIMNEKEIFDGIILLFAMEIANMKYGLSDELKEDMKEIRKYMEEKLKNYE